MFDDYEVNREAEQGFDDDNKDHARTSKGSLRRYARKLNMLATDVTKRREVERWLKDPYRRAPNKAQYWTKRTDWGLKQEAEALAWLDAHSQGYELDPELETEDGKQVQGTNTPMLSGGNAAFTLREESSHEDRLPEDDKCSDTWETAEPDYSVAGSGGGSIEDSKNMFLGELQCYKSDDELFDELTADNSRYTEFREHALTYGKTYAARRVMRKIRAKRLKKHLDKAAVKNRWRGMEEYDAVAKATAKQEEGKRRTKDVSNAKPLPDIGRLHELFRVEDGKLVNKRLDRVVRAKRLKIDGEFYVTSRVLYALETGEDPGTKMVRQGVATHYRKAEGSVRFDRDTDEGVFWEARVQLGPDIVTVGSYKRRVERKEGQDVVVNVAEEAIKLYLKSLEM